MNVNSLIEDKFIMEKPRQSLNRRERDRLLRQADILRAAEHVFALKGYHEATMQDIAKEAQYAIGTVYLYFKDKDALYLSLVEHKYRDLLAILKEETVKAKTAKEKIEIFIYETLSFFERNQNFFRIFVSERNKNQEIKVGKLRKLSVVIQHKEFVVELIKSAQEQQIIRSDFSAKQIADILISIFMSVVFNWFKEGSKGIKNLSSMSSFILDMFLNGAAVK
ncbi:MAG: TetR/AcrR family transcriptional regulator [Candidatus Omnitrophica bacterium]|nr:TetR/AcrR family transcriptional regulator [Candidatus Omnitrophota bacterium]